MPNIEIKALYPDLDKARAIARVLKARYMGRDRQVDTYFRTPAGRLKLRESALKGAQLIPCVRPNRKGPKQSDYLVIPVEKGSEAKRLFEALFGIDAVVDKQRDLFLSGNVRIHLDRVKGLGDFLEFEAVYKTDSAKNRAVEKGKVEKLLRIFEVPSKSLLRDSYRELVLKRKFRK